MEINYFLLFVIILNLTCGKSDNCPTCSDRLKWGLDHWKSSRIINLVSNEVIKSVCIAKNDTENCVSVIHKHLPDFFAYYFSSEDAVVDACKMYEPCSEFIVYQDIIDCKECKLNMMVGFGKLIQPVYLWSALRKFSNSQVCQERRKSCEEFINIYGLDLKSFFSLSIRFDRICEQKLTCKEHEQIYFSS